MHFLTVSVPVPVCVYKLNRRERWMKADTDMYKGLVLSMALTYVNGLMKKGALGFIRNVIFVLLLLIIK